MTASWLWWFYLKISRTFSTFRGNPRHGTMTKLTLLLAAICFISDSRKRFSENDISLCAKSILVLIISHSSPWVLTSTPPYYNVLYMKLLFEKHSQTWNGFKYDNYDVNWGTNVLFFQRFQDFHWPSICSWEQFTVLAFPIYRLGAGYLKDCLLPR